MIGTRGRLTTTPPSPVTHVAVQGELGARLEAGQQRLTPRVRMLPDGLRPDAGLPFLPGQIAERDDLGAGRGSRHGPDATAAPSPTPSRLPTSPAGAIVGHASGRSGMTMDPKSGCLNGLVDVERGVVSREIFVNEEVYRQEQERIFARVWLFIGHESQIPTPGDF